MARVRGIKQPHPLGSLASRAGVSQLTAASGGTTSGSPGGVKISALPEAVAANDIDQLEVNQAGTSRRVTVDQLGGRIAEAISEFSPRSFGAVGDGVTDDTAALQAAIDACAAAGGGNVNCTGGRWLIDSANILVGRGVYLAGPYRNHGQDIRVSAGNAIEFLNSKSAFIINPSFRIRLNDHDSGITGMIAFRKGMTQPTSLSTAYTAVQAFAGTAIEVGDETNYKAADCWLSHLLIVGFEFGIRSVHQSRLRISWISGDNTNGIYMSQSGDMQHLSHVHFWPFFTSHQAWANTQYAVSNAVDNGSGLIRLTIATHALKTGDSVTVFDVGGVTNANSRWTVTVINSTTVDLQGSTFAGVYTPATGTVHAGLYWRSGVGINFDDTVDWGQMDTCFTYAYATGIRVSNSNHGTLVNCGTDNWAGAKDPTSIGIHITGTSGATALIGCKTAAAGVGLKIEISAPNENNVTVTNHRAWGLVTYAVQIVSGIASFVNCEIQTTEAVRIEPGATEVTFIGGDLTGATMSYATAAPQAQFIGVAGAPTTSSSTQFVSTGASGNRQMLSLIHDNATRANGNATYQSTYMRDAAGTLVETSRTSHTITDITAGAASGNTIWAVRDAGTLTSIATANRLGIGPATHDTVTCGYTNAYWSNTYTVLATVRTQLTTQANVAIGAASTAQHFVKASTTANFGLFYGAGAPTALSAAKGSLYTNTTATTTTTRLYVNTDGGTTWATLTTSA